MFNLKDKIAIITGASQGIGKSTAKIFSNAGAHVVCLARNKKKIQHLVHQISEDGNSATGKQNLFLFFLNKEKESFKSSTLKNRAVG